jgi:hypothetical protein
MLQIDRKLFAVFVLAIASPIAAPWLFPGFLAPAITQ